MHAKPFCFHINTSTFCTYNGRLRVIWLLFSYHNNLRGHDNKLQLLKNNIIQRPRKGNRLLNQIWFSFLLTMDMIWLFVSKLYLTWPSHGRDDRTSSKWRKVLCGWQYFPRKGKSCKNHVRKVKEKTSHIWSAASNKFIVNSHL